LAERSKLLYSASMSLDGYIAGPGGDMSWLSAHLGSGPKIDDLVESIGSLLIGRRTYGGDDPNAGTEREGPFGGRWHGQSVVLTHDPPPQPWPDDVTFLADLEAAIRTAKEAAAGRYVNVLGADVARQCLEIGELDEVLVYIAPQFLGDGVALFEHPGGRSVALDPIDPGAAGPTGLRFRVRV
jgi:dihydrofolate reductase